MKLLRAEMIEAYTYRLSHLHNKANNICARSIYHPPRRNVRTTRIEQTAVFDPPASSSTPSPVRSVVSTFLCTGQPGTPSFRVAILRRGRASHVYAGKWAVISGSVKADADASPLAAAMRELREETALGEADVEVLVHGQPYDVSDQKLRVYWRIFPFLTRIKGVKGTRNGGESAERTAQSAKAKIRLDEEHDEIAFVCQEEMNKYDTVDGLSQTLEELVKQWQERRTLEEGDDSK